MKYAPKGTGIALLLGLALMAPCEEARAQTYVSPDWGALDRLSALEDGSAAVVPHRTTRQVQSTPPLGFVIFGTVRRTALGILAGGLVGYLIDSDTRDSWIGATEEMLVGALVGSTVGSSVGAYLANNQRGNVYLSVVAAGIASSVSVLLAEKRPLAIVYLPAVHIAFGVSIVRLTD